VSIRLKSFTLEHVLPLAPPCYDTVCKSKAVHLLSLLYYSILILKHIKRDNLELHALKVL